jgi:uncharacterized membrane protein
MLVTICLRLLGVAQWSLWEDEETTIFFSLNLDKAFPRTFPLFFGAVHWLYALTGISYAAGRVLAGLFGVIQIWLTYMFLKKHVARDVGVIAALLLGLCWGHLFWSQSIRYYTLLLMMETLASLLLFEGLEEGKYGKLLAAALCIVIAMLVHFSAILLMPVWGGYLIFTCLLRERPRLYGWRGWCAVGLPTLVGMLILVPRFVALQQTGALGAAVTPQGLAGLLVRIVVYYGAPMVALALLAPWVASRPYQRSGIFLTALGLIPILELLVIDHLRLATALWYHGFIAMVGVAGLAGIGLAGLHALGWRRCTALVATGTVVYYGVFLGLYYTALQGDRPRWREAAAYVQQRLGRATEALDPPAVFATVPGVVAHYLGVEPGQTMGHPLVRGVPSQPPQTRLRQASWYLVQTSHISAEYDRWFHTVCKLQDRFKASAGPIDRSIVVYFCSPTL